MITVKVTEIDKVSLVICKILRLLVKMLTVDDNYSLVNRDNLTQHTFRWSYLKTKKPFLIFLCIIEIYIKF